MRIGEQEMSGVRFAVTVDTEADDAWSRPEQIEVTNIRQLDRFQDLCDKYDIVPTYLCAYECATRDEALSILTRLAKERRCEIGHHLHSWTTPPFQNRSSGDVDLDWIHAFQFQLPDSLFIEKAECLRQAIECAFGRSPTSHRAGRWGIDQRTIDWLASSGFAVDTSMRTAFRIREFRTGIGLEVMPGGRRVAATEYEWRRNPYIWPSEAKRETGDAIVEIPVTVDTPRGVASAAFLRFLSLKWPGEYLFYRAYRKLSGGLRVLYPDPRYPSGTLPEIMRKAASRGSTALTLVLHSSELAMGCSPFTRTQELHDRLWDHLEEAFRFARQQGIKSEGISSIAQLTGCHA